VRGDTIDVFPAEHMEVAVRIELLDDEIESILLFDPLTGRAAAEGAAFHDLSVVALRDAAPDRVARDRNDQGRAEGTRRVLIAQGKLVEAQRLEQRTRSRPGDAGRAGLLQGDRELHAPPVGGAAGRARRRTLIDYLPPDALMIIDESHVTVPQLGAMYRGDRSRKETLVEYGFRLPSALDNRPLRFDEFERKMRRCMFVSATPSTFELERSSRWSSNWCGRPGWSIRGSKCGPPGPRSTTCSPRSRCAWGRASACW